MKLTQKDRNKRIISVDLSPEERQACPDRIRVSGRMECLGKSYPVLEEELPLVEGSLQITAPFFGTVWFTVALLREGEIIANREEKIHVVADQYWISPLIATTPVLLFGLRYFSEGVPTGEKGDSIPTILTLVRGGDPLPQELPENIYVNPYLVPGDWIGKDGGDLTGLLPKMEEYIRQLYRGNPEARFTFFFNDCHMEWMVPKLYRIIPREKRSLRAITDGGRTQYFFRYYYVQPDSPRKSFRIHRAIVAVSRKINVARLLPVNLRRPGWLAIRIGDCFGFLEYAGWPLTLQEQDARWWIMDRDRFISPDPGLQEEFLGNERIEEVSISELYRKVEEKGNLDALFRLLRYDDRLIREIEEEGKVPVLTQGGNEVNHENFPKYLRKLREQLGEEYDLLVKSHPGATEEARTLIEDAETDGTFKMLYSEAPAELFLLHHPKMLLAGYPSTTFSTSVCPDRHLALFDMSREEAMKDPLTRGYAPTVRWFVPSPDGEIEETDPFAVAAAAEDTHQPAR